jgi:outer membrane protein OmpA-like peptidoglycan-associated protein
LSEGRRGSTEDEANFFNLDLSQRRAAAVLAQCLQDTGSDAVGRWARERATAVDHSSSRLIRNSDGSEDPVRSRWVMFSASVTSDDILTGIGEMVGN